MTLKCLITGTGRDGTTTARVLACNLAVANDDVPDARHETDISRLYNAWVRGCEEGRFDQAHREIQSIVGAWSHRTESSSGHAFWLEAISDLNPEIRLVHLKRDKDSCIRSLVENRLTWPEYHGNYAPDRIEDRKIAFKTWLPAAFHFGEMTQEDWFSLDPPDRCAWYYEKTHALIDEKKVGFADVLDVSTESLSAPETVSRIRAFVEPAYVNDVGPVVQNLANPYRSLELSTTERRELELIFNAFDYFKLLESQQGPVYGLQHFMKLLATEGQDGANYEALMRAQRQLAKSIVQHRPRWIRAIAMELSVLPLKIFK